MPNPNIRLYSPNASATVRSGVTSADAGSWTPESEGTPTDFILDAREWETVRLVADNTGANTVSVQPLRSMWQAAEPGRSWATLGSAINTMAVGEMAEIATEGGFVAFRVTAVSAGTATLRVTGGKKRRNIAGG